jgi:hypothetical protein
MKNLPGRFAGVVLLGVAVLLYDAASGSPVHRLLVPIAMAIAAWLMVQNAAAVLLGAALLTAIHSDPLDPDWITGRAYPALAIISGGGKRRISRGVSPLSFWPKEDQTAVFRDAWRVVRSRILAQRAAGDHQRTSDGCVPIPSRKTVRSRPIFTEPIRRGSVVADKHPNFVPVTHNRDSSAQTLALSRAGNKNLYDSA